MTLSSVIFCLIFTLNVFAAGPIDQSGKSAAKKPIDVPTLFIPPCQEILIGFYYNLEAVSLKVNGKNIKEKGETEYIVSSPVLQSMKVDMKVRGEFGLIWISSNTGYWYIALVYDGKVDPLLPPPPMP